MSTLVDRPGRAPVPNGPRRPSVDGRVQLLTGALAAVQAAGASLVLVLVPVVLTWATAAFSSAPWQEALRAGTATWLLAHGAGLVLAGGHFGLIPLGLTLVPVVSCWLAGVRLARTLDPHADAVRRGIGRARPVAPPRRALAALVLTYAGLVTLAAVATATASVRPVLPQAFVGAAVICTLSAGAGCAAWVAGGLRPGLRLLLRRMPLPVLVRRCVRPLGLALGVQLFAGLVLVVWAVVNGRDQVLALHHDLAPGFTGGLVLVLAQLVLVPDLVVWAGSWAAGPGFAVGAGTALTPVHTVLGALPTVPVLGALPAPGEWPGWVRAVSLLPVVAGVVGGWALVQAFPAGGPLLRGRRSAKRSTAVVGPADPAFDRLLGTDRRDAAAGADARVGAGVDTDDGRDPAPGSQILPMLSGIGLLALSAGAGWAVLGLLTTGPAGPGRLAEMGPTPWLLGLATAAEVGLGGLLALAAKVVASSRRGG